MFEYRVESIWQRADVGPKGCVPSWDEQATSRVNALALEGWEPWIIGPPGSFGAVFVFRRAKG